MKIAVLGEKKSVLPFRALGAEVFGIRNEQDLAEVKARIEKDDFALVFVTEEVAMTYQKALEPLYQGALPALVVIPGAHGSAGRGSGDLVKSMERALGSSKIAI